jgi:hypothetical protein
MSNYINKKSDLSDKNIFELFRQKTVIKNFSMDPSELSKQYQIYLYYVEQNKCFKTPCTFDEWFLYTFQKYPIEKFQYNKICKLI